MPKLIYPTSDANRLELLRLTSSPALLPNGEGGNSQSGRSLTMMRNEGARTVCRLGE